MNHPATPSKLFAVAVSEWLLVLPPAMLLAGAALRQLQPVQHEPARTISVIFEWLGPHISRAGAALLFLALPGIAVVAGCAVLLLIWRSNEAFRHDVTAALACVRRSFAVVVLGVGTLLAGAILAAVLMHMITD